MLVPSRHSHSQIPSSKETVQRAPSVYAIVLDLMYINIHSLHMPKTCRIYIPRSSTCVLQPNQNRLNQLSQTDSIKQSSSHNNNNSNNNNSNTVNHPCCYSPRSNPPKSTRLTKRDPTYYTSRPIALPHGPIVHLAVLLKSRG